LGAVGSFFGGIGLQYHAAMCFLAATRSKDR
jgi:hypothetical protein